MFLSSCEKPIMVEMNVGQRVNRRWMIFHQRFKFVQVRYIMVLSDASGA
jgi:hypothetical protein